MRKILVVLGVADIVVMACGVGGGGASTPEDAVNGAFNAMKSGNIDAATQYMPEADRSEIDGETVVVTVEMTAMGQSMEQEVDLIKENGRWVITGGVRIL